MIEMMKQAIDVLKNKISSNLEEIRSNEHRFRKIMSNSDLSEQADEMNSLLEMNKNLLSQNFDFLNIQLSMLKFLEKMKNHQTHSGELSLEDIDQIHQSVDFFEFTTNGSIPFNGMHPLVYDEFFWGELIHYYTENKMENEAEQVLCTLLMSRVN